MEFLVVQALSGLASASSLFLVASGLSIIFGVTRIVNFAHGSLYMLGAYCAYSAVGWLDGLGAPGWAAFWIGLPLAALIVAGIGAVLEVTLLRRIYAAPELFQLLATFGVVLVVQDLVVALWGAEDLLGPRAPGLSGAVQVFGRAVPTWDIFLMVLGPGVLLLLWLLFTRTRWGILVRAATHDRDMVAALGVNQSRLFLSVFMLGAGLAGLGGAVQIPREAVHHAMDLTVIVEVFVVVVIGGLGSVPGAFLAALLISELNAFGILILPEITMVLPFVVMAIVLVVRPHGLLGRAEGHPAPASGQDAHAPFRRLAPWARWSVFGGVLALALLPLLADDYTLSLAAEALIFALFASSLHFIMGVGGMVSFGHAAVFGLGAYGAALAAKHLGAPMEVALLAAPAVAALGAALFGWFCVRLSGVYLAMLTLAFAQVVWATAFQWYDVTGGDNGILGLWPPDWASSAAAFYGLCLVIAGGGLLMLRRFAFAPFGYGLRACRDSALRAEAMGLDRRWHQWLGFLTAGTFAGMAGGLFAYLKGSVFPDTASVSVSVDGLVMVLLGGIETLSGPVVGAVAYKVLQTTLSSSTEYWRGTLGVVILTLVLLFPRGLVGTLVALRGRLHPGASR